MNRRIVQRNLVDTHLTVHHMARPTTAPPATFFPPLVVGTMMRRVCAGSPRLAMLVPLLLAAIIAAGSPARAQTSTENTYRSATTRQPQLQLDHGQRWPVDVALRDGMQRIHVVVNWMQRMQVDGTLSTRQSRAATVSIEDSVDAIVKDPPRGAGIDSNLHILLARVLDADGLSQLLDALALYPRYFDDPQWQPVQHIPPADH